MIFTMVLMIFFNGSKYEPFTTENTPKKPRTQRGFCPRYVLIVPNPIHTPMVKLLVFFFLKNKNKKRRCCFAIENGSVLLEILAFYPYF